MTNTRAEFMKKRRDKGGQWVAVTTRFNVHQAFCWVLKREREKNAKNAADAEQLANRFGIYSAFRSTANPNVVRWFGKDAEQDAKNAANDINSEELEAIETNVRQ